LVEVTEGEYIHKRYRIQQIFLSKYHPELEENAYRSLWLEDGQHVSFSESMLERVYEYDEDRGFKYDEDAPLNDIVESIMRG
jgi:hypothetical protein